MTKKTLPEFCGKFRILNAISTLQGESLYREISIISDQIGMERSQLAYNKANESFLISKNDVVLHQIAAKVVDFGRWVIPVKSFEAVFNKVVAQLKNAATEDCQDITEISGFEDLQTEAQAALDVELAKIRKKRGSGEESPH